MEPIHIRECYDQTSVLCGGKFHESISYMHAIEYMEDKHKHLDKLEVCDDCWEQFKQQQPAFYRDDDPF